MITYADLREIDTEVNGNTTYTSDPVKYGLPEFWEVADGEGDCEDYALAKMQKLKARGVPVTDMRLATVFAPPFDENNKGKRGHAVLLVKIGTTEYCLDNMTRQPEPVDLVTHEFHKLQIPGTRQWEWAEGADRRFA